MQFRWLIVLVAVLFAAVPLLAEGAEDADDSDSDVDKLAERVQRLEDEIATLKKARDKWADWTVDISGEFRARAIVEANTQNNFVNNAGEVLYAYQGDSTTSGDYGWWDYRTQLRLDVGWRDRTSLHAFIQIGNAVWGNQAPLFGGSEELTLGNTELVFRELYVEVGMEPIPLRMKFGRFDVELGNRLILGVESDGLDVWYRNQYLKAGFIGLRHYEGERFEYSINHNDDEDAFAAYVQGYFTPEHSLLVFGYLELYEIPKNVGTPSNPKSPLYNLPRWDPTLYNTQSSNLYTFGANWVSEWPTVTLNLEGDFQTGAIYPGDDTPTARAIDFSGYAAFAKVDWRFSPQDVLFVSGGYGSGDDPGTTDFEGFFAPRNDFGIEEDYHDEYLERGYFAVYEHRSPGAGVPGDLMEGGRGTGGIENTIFALLGLDLGFLANHHFYFGAGPIWAARENPKTGSHTIGVEVDMSVDYYFLDHVMFRLYGGHLFVLGDYFRKDAYDAAVINFEWKVYW